MKTMERRRTIPQVMSCILRRKRVNLILIICAILVLAFVLMFPDCGNGEVNLNEAVAVRGAEKLFNLHDMSLKYMSDAGGLISYFDQQEERPVLQNTRPNETLDMFQSIMTTEDKMTVRLLLKVFSHLLKDRVDFWLYCGSLLGSYRHHGIIPWDDDVDVLVSNKDRDVMFSLLADLEPFFFLDINAILRWKFYLGTSKAVPGLPWKWPSIDISFYTENVTHIWDIDVRYPRFVYLKEDIFPLSSRPFMDLMLPSPYNAEKVLSVNFDVNECRTNKYDHRREQRSKRIVSVPCRLLVDLHPFVKRERRNDFIKEVLYLKDKPLQEVKFKLVLPPI